MNNVCHDCGAVLESPIEIGHDTLLCSSSLTVTLYRCYCRVCRSYWHHLGMRQSESKEGQALNPGIYKTHDMRNMVA